MQIPEPQFRDNFFIPTHPRSPNLQLPSRHTPRLPSPWTNKLKAQLRIALSPRSPNNLFEAISPPQQPLRPSTLRTKALPFCMRTEGSSGRTTKQGHFLLSKNVYNREIHEDLSRSGILEERLETNHPQDRRLCLKNLKIRSNMNQYRGNFCKFTKNERGGRQRGQLTLDSDLSPWEFAQSNSEH